MYGCAVIGSLMMVSVLLPGGGDDEEDYITELELVKITMEAGTWPRIAGSAAISTLNSSWRFIAQQLGLVLCLLA